MISGRLKFFTEQLADLSRGAKISWINGPANDASVKEALSLFPGSYWQGQNAPDNAALTETLTIDLPSSEKIDTIILLNHNLGQFSFTLNGLDLNLTDLVNKKIRSGSLTSDKSFSYFKLENPFNAKKFVIHASISQRGSDPKRIGTILLLKELGTLEGYPEIKTFSFSQNEEKTMAKDGRYFINKQVRRLVDLKLSFKNYVSNSDQTLISSIFDRDRPLLIWPCGGYQKFRYSIDGFNLNDIFKMQTLGRFSTGLSGGSYAGVMDFNVKFVESV